MLCQNSRSLPCKHYESSAICQFKMVSLSPVPFSLVEAGSSGNNSHPYHQSTAPPAAFVGREDSMIAAVQVSWSQGTNISLGSVGFNTRGIFTSAIFLGSSGRTMDEGSFIRSRHLGLSYGPPLICTRVVSRSVTNGNTVSTYSLG